MTSSKKPNTSLPDSSRLIALSPIDGRYAAACDPLREWFSEYGLIRHRVLVEVEWFKTLAATPGVAELPPQSKATTRFLDDIVKEFDVRDARRVKTIERTTNHDVKAVEYFLRERFKRHPSLRRHTHFLHFACTSWDINNLAYSLMLNGARKQALLPALKKIRNTLARMARSGADAAMMSRTHGQPASPTTMGKELANFAHRLDEQTAALAAVRLNGKINGAVGNYNAHVAAYPDVNWPAVARRFVTRLGFRFNAYTTQIEPYDSTAELLHATIRVNNILIDLCRDLWAYISLAYFKQKTLASQVGSSTMPHKVNPIDFENAEGNLGAANALASHLASSLCISRLQRDLSDSTALRTLGATFGHALTAANSVSAGLAKLRLDRKACADELKAHGEVLGEALQTVMRKNGVEDAYERIKELTRGRTVSRETLHAAIKSCRSLKPADKARLLKLEPETYLGLATELAKAFGRTTPK